MRAAATISLLDCLTRTEGTIMRLILNGYSNSDIARARGKSVSTVANQAYAIYRKLGVNSRRELRACSVRTTTTGQGIP